ALEAMRAPVASTLRDEAGSSGGRRSTGVRGVLVASQMALSTILLVGAALFVRSLQAAADMDLGFSTRQAAVVDVSTGPSGYTTEERVALIEELGRRLQAEAGVTHFGVTGRMPLDLGVRNLAFDVPGVEPPPDQSRHVLEYAPVTPGYFETMGIDILEGRAFQDSDRPGSPDVVILSLAAARRYWPDGSAVGRTVYAGSEGERALTVVGVADNAKIWSLGEAPFAYMYRPYFQGQETSAFSIVARGSQDPGEIAAIIRDEARAIDPDLFITDVGTLRDHLGYVYFLPRMAAALLSLVGLLALTLACLGLYGMVSYTVARRTREMGIRLALGAERSKVIAMVLKSSLVLVGAGAFLGIVGSIFVGRMAERFLYGSGALDPLALMGAPLLLGIVAATASYLPARRAARVDPVRALRTE
ncbi:MAG: FtsX-like permease family protein, partial [Longimicrobiales bacterium]|nr:FtsX-like permease family protein [Longimicrobiales bacterium]